MSDSMSIPGYAQASAHYENMMPPEPTAAEQEGLEREALIMQAVEDLGLTRHDIAEWDWPEDGPVIVWLGAGGRYEINVVGGRARAVFTSVIDGVDCA